MMARFIVQKHLQCTLTLTYEVEADDRESAIEVVRGDDGLLEPTSEETTLNTDPCDRYDAVETW